ncbi:hypothetical protein [Ferrovibrio xuzhouensis]|uniref:DUF2846 domain-containing protein n=1 Tax=Ferrovibrio xuzhouensis TaxID=1576914 RepID=A0ABV7VEN6_9PROT
MRRGIFSVVILAALGGCQTMKPKDATPDMQMPPKPADTARIVLFRKDAMTGAPSTAPVVSLDGEALGEIDDETLFIRDVPPGVHRITLAMAAGAAHDNVEIDPPLLIADINAGGEWYIETVLTQPCSAGTRPVNLMSAPTGTIVGDAALAGISLASAALARATLSCREVYVSQPSWPLSTWNLNPLLAKAGAKPAEPAADRTLPQSGLSWTAVSEKIQDDVTSHDDDYKSRFGFGEHTNLLVQEIGFVSDDASGTPKRPRITVTLDYLQVDQETLVGQHARRRLQYTLTRDGDTLAVASWQVVAP